MTADSRALLVAGIPASGKTAFAKTLARELGWAYLDLDTLTIPLFERLGGEDVVDAARAASPGRAGVNAVRYQCLFDTAAENLAVGMPVVMVAPFTSERSDPAAWATVAPRLGVTPDRVDLAWMDTPFDEIVARMTLRNAARDQSKIARPTEFLPASAFVPPAVPHLRIDGLSTTAAQVRAFVEDTRLVPRR